MDSMTMKIVFDCYDNDASGFIDASEFHAMCYKLGQFLSPEETAVRFDLYGYACFACFTFLFFFEDCY